MKTENNIITQNTLEEGYDFYIKDKWKKNRHFKISTFPVPTGMLSEAIEVVRDEEFEPKIFTILSPFDSDIENSELNLKARIKRGINKRYLKKEIHGYELANNDEMAGRIEWNSKTNEPSLIVDGKRLSMDQLEKILSPYEGFQFKLQIIDPSDEL